MQVQLRCCHAVAQAFALLFISLAPRNVDCSRHCSSTTAFVITGDAVCRHAWHSAAIHAAADATSCFQASISSRRGSTGHGHASAGCQWPVHAAAAPIAAAAAADAAAAHAAAVYGAPTSWLWRTGSCHAARWRVPWLSAATGTRTSGLSRYCSSLLVL